MTAPPTLREFTVHGHSTATVGRVLCSTRNHHFVVDGPVTNGCPGEALTPPELFLSAIAGCGVELVQVIARDEGTALGDVAVRVHGTVDRSRQAREDVTTFTSLQLHFTIDGTDDAAAARLVEGFKRR